MGLFGRKAYMDLRTFQVMAVAVARLHLRSRQDISELAADIAHHYRNEYCVDEAARLPREVSEAANLLLQSADHVIKSEVLDPSPRTYDELLRQFQWYASVYEADGQPKRKRLLNGTAFNQADLFPNRPVETAAQFIFHASQVLRRARPAAPDGWELQIVP